MTMMTNGVRRSGAVADFHEDGDMVRRSVTIRRSLDDVRTAWETAGISGTPQFSEAPGELGTELRVTAPKDQQSALDEIIGAWKSDDPGESLSTRLRQFKGRMETGEVATTIGQPSGREAIDTAPAPNQPTTTH